MCSPKKDAVWVGGWEEGRKVLHSTIVVVDIGLGTDVVVGKNRYMGYHSGLGIALVEAADLVEVHIDIAAVKVEEEGVEVDHCCEEGQVLSLAWRT
jgi:hypothetical protein